ncbi:MAG: hypothetical protein BRD49_04630 [Bacteroidetes bacterium SW_10_40_5]|nr:MAG: hypothetical protein BRD49_04630 [Bacteroidetes bacterium SW_10_40_5]
MNPALVDFLLRASYVLLGIAVLGIIVFSIFQIVQNPKQSFASIGGFIGIVIVFLIAFSSATTFANKGNLSPEMIQFAGGGLITLYLLGIIAIAGIIAGEIWTMIK